jgi:hypothetical protein
MANGLPDREDMLMKWGIRTLLPRPARSQKIYPLSATNHKFCFDWILPNAPIAA